MTGLSDPPANLSIDVQHTPTHREASVAVIELVLKLLWGLSPVDRRPPHVIFDSGNSS